MAAKWSLPLASAALILFTAGAAQAEGDATLGEKTFKKCKACHVVDSDKNRVGPSLKNVIGRAAGGVEGFKYSKAMVAYGESGAVWDEATLDPYLMKPRAAVKGTKMAFPGLKKPEDRANVIAYLKQVAAEN